MPSGPQDCNTHCCPVNSQWHGWGDWSECTASCGGGTKTRSRDKTPASCGGTDYGGASTETVACNEQCCARDCQWGEWSDYTECSLTCGGGTKNKTRVIAVEADCGGAPCQGLTYNTTKCNTDCCRIDCMWGEWGQYGDCNRPCGGGNMTRTRDVEVQAACWGTVCAGTHEENAPCNEDCCPADCPIPTIGPPPLPPAALSCPSIGDLYGLLKPANGDMKCTDGNKIGSVCTFRCDDGYKVTMPSQSTCLPSLLWSTSSPVCEKEIDDTCAHCRTLDQIYISTGCLDGSLACDTCPIYARSCFDVKKHMCQSGYMFKVLVSDVSFVPDDEDNMSFGARVLKVFHSGEGNDATNKILRFKMKQKCVEACVDPILMIHPQEYLIPDRTLYIAGPAPVKNKDDDLEYHVSGRNGFIQRLLPDAKCAKVLKKYQKKCVNGKDPICYDLRKRFITCNYQDAFENSIAPSDCS